MADYLKNVVYGDATKIDTIMSGGQVSGHTYDANNLYEEELAPDIVLAADTSGMTVDTDNQLKLNADGSTVVVNDDNTVSAAIPDMVYL